MEHQRKRYFRDLVLYFRLLSRLLGCYCRSMVVFLVFLGCCILFWDVSPVFWVVAPLFMSCYPFFRILSFLLGCYAVFWLFSPYNWLLPFSGLLPVYFSVDPEIREQQPTIELNHRKKEHPQEWGQLSRNTGTTSLKRVQNMDRRGQQPSNE